MRHNQIGSSMIPAILGLTPGGRDPMWAFMKLTDQLPDTPMTDEMQAGVDLEPYVLERYAQKMELPYAGFLPRTALMMEEHRLGDITFADFQSGMGDDLLHRSLVRNYLELNDGVQFTFRHPQHEWAVASPDAFLIRDKLIVEAKTVGYHNRNQWGETDWAAPTGEIPPHYQAQVRWQMFVMDFDVVHIPVLIAGQEFRLYRLHRDKEIEEMMREVGEIMWTKHVVPWRNGDRNCAPEITESDASATYLKTRFRESTEEVLKADAEATELARQFAEAVNGLKAAEARHDLLENRIKNRMGIALGLIGKDFKFTWKVEMKSHVNYKQLIEDLKVEENVLARYRSLTPSRVFRKAGTWFPRKGVDVE